MTSSSAGGFDFAQLEAPPPPADGYELARETAEPDLEAIAGAAHREGFEAGYRDGLDEARAALESAVRALAASVAEIDRLRDGALDDLEREAVGLALAVAEKVVAGALAVQPERVLDAVRGALRRLIERERVVIAVNPDDLAFVREAAAEVVESLGGIERYEVQEERRVDRGGALVRTDRGEIDATIRAKLDSARRVVEGELGS